MRYITDAKKKRAQDRARGRAERLHWITLVEAVKYIKDRQRCGVYEGVEDLLCAIVDGKVRALSGDISRVEESISAYQLLSPGDLRRGVKVCLDVPGLIDLYPLNIAEGIDYPKVSIVAGRIGKVMFDESDPCSPPVFPEVDELEYGPVLISRDDLEKWPFAAEEKPDQAHSVAAQSAEATEDVALDQHELPTFEAQSARHRRDATIVAIKAIWGPSGVPSGIMTPNRDGAINDWLKHHGRQTVSSKTIRRALKELDVAAVDRG
jgi:hypothetical protein